MPLPRRSFLTGLLALPAALWPFKAEARWVEASPQDAVRLTATEIERRWREWDEMFLKAFWEKAKKEGIPEPGSDFQYYQGKSIT